MLPRFELLSSNATDIMNKNHDIIYVNPAKADKEADNNVEGRATFDATVAITNTAKPIVTGKGTTLLPDVVVPMVTIVVVLSVIQFCPLVSATRGEVQEVTQIPFSCRGKEEGQGLVH